MQCSSRLALIIPVSYACQQVRDLGVLSVSQFELGRPLSKVIVGSSVLLTYNESLQLTAQLAGASWVPSAAYGRSGVS